MPDATDRSHEQLLSAARLARQGVDRLKSAPAAETELQMTRMLVVLYDLTFAVECLAERALAAPSSAAPRRPHREDIAAAAQANREQRRRMRLAERRVGDALYLHQPCHVPGGEPWSCIYHSGEHGYPQPEDRAVCINCSYDDRRVPWPCATAHALGAPTAMETR